MPYRQMKRQPRAKAMLPAIKELITIRALEDRDKDRTLLAHELRDEIKAKFPQEIAPTKETIIKRVSEARSKGSDPLDVAWHLGILNKLHDLGIPDISAEGVDAILKVQRWLSNAGGQAWVDVHQKKKKITKLGYGSFAYLYGTLTIRQAKWIAALYRNTGDDPKYLWLVSFYYAYHEIISNISNTPFNTKNIDANLCHGKATFFNMLRSRVDSELNIYGDNLEKALKILGKNGRLEGE